MDKQSKNRLPEQCLFMNANGEIMRIEYGKSGFSRSELNTENRKANQVIVNGYNERHGITAEQIDTMHQGALFGWDVLQLSRQEQSGMKSDRIFAVEISRPGSFGAETSSALTLPAAQYEISDALDKARITDERVIYSAEIIGCELDYLPQFIGTNANLYELNYLAERLSSLNEWELDCFEGMVMMDTIRIQYSPIAVERLINMTHSMNDCHVVYEETLPYFLRQFELIERQKDLIVAGGGEYYENRLFIAKPDGSPYKRDRMSANFGQLIRHLEMPHIRFHDLRHTAATNMHQLTGDFYTVGEILGHTLKGIGMSLGISTNLEAVTAQYVDVRLERKKTVLETYHKALEPRKPDIEKGASKQGKKKSSEMEL